jgi:beta-lactam-binding protein with PASTA domain
VVAILVLAILVLVAVRLTLSASSSSTPTDTVPDLQGKTISEAAKAAGEEVVVTPYFFNGEPVRASNQPKGTIIDQIPKAGQSSSGPIFVELSGGQEKVKVPDVSGMYSPQAGKVLIDAGLAPDFDVAFDGNGNSRVFTNANKNDEKIGVTDPPSGEVVDAGTHIVPLGEK